MSGVPRSSTCIADEGEYTHNWAALPTDHVHVPVAMQEVELHQGATIVQFFIADA